MRRGPKSTTAAEKLARGTFQPVRDLATVTVVDPGSLPQRPEWLTEDGAAVWLDNVGRVSATKGATELDSDLFANFCCLQGAVTKAWREGGVPPVSALTEIRRMMELLRLGGPSSRVAKIGDGEKAGGNPFLKARR